jgi:hypothetical protein
MLRAAAQTPAAPPSVDDWVSPHLTWGEIIAAFTGVVPSHPVFSEPAGPPEPEPEPAPAPPPDEPYGT